MTPAKIYPLQIGAPQKLSIFLVGCGGTGSYAALHLSQLAWVARQHGIETRLTFIDPDTVEPKNIARQNFAPPEVGRAKADTLAWRYALALGLAITPIVACFNAEHLLRHKFNPRFDTNVLNLVVGCVDNSTARQDIAAAILTLPNAYQPDLWWLDAGNHYAHGQVLLGNSTYQQPLLSPLGFAYALPLPHIQNPELTKAQEQPPAEAAPSCADLTLMDIQSRTINKMMAAWIDVYAEGLVMGRDLRIMATELDQRSGAAVSRPITGGIVLEDRQKQSKSPVAGYPAGYPASREREEGDPAGVNCPECQTELLFGQDVIDDEEQDIYFCPACDWLITVEDYQHANSDAELLACGRRD